MFGDARNRIVAVLTVGIFLGASARATWAREEIAKLTPCEVPGGASGFGNAVGISGDYIVVGAGDATAQSTGAACVYRRDGMTWAVQATLLGSEVGFHDNFGFSVAIDGDLIVVGAPHNDQAGDGLGFAYVFRREGSEWVEESKLVPSGSELTDFFGWSVDIEGDRVVVGAWGETLETGAAYVFRRDGMTWVEEARMTASDGAFFDWFGWSVSISGAFLISAARLDDHAGPTSGSAYVFRREATTWIEDIKLTASDAGAGQAFGASVSIAGGCAAVGAFRADGATTDSGAVYVFRRKEDKWTQEAKLTASDGAAFDDFGARVAIQAELIVVAGGGSPYLFKRYDTTWFELDKLIASDGNDRLGAFISVDAGLAVVGGSAYVFSLAGDIPALSEWGTIILGLVLLTAGSIILRRTGTGKPYAQRTLHVGVTIFILTSAASAQIPDFSAPHDPEHLLVRFNPDTSDQTRQLVHTAAGGQDVRRYRIVEGLTLVKVPPESLQEASSAYRNDSNVLYAEP